MVDVVGWGTRYVARADRVHDVELREAVEWMVTSKSALGTDDAWVARLHMSLRNEEAIGVLSTVTLGANGRREQWPTAPRRGADSTCPWRTRSSRCGGDSTKEWSNGEGEKQWPKGIPLTNPLA